MKRKLDKALSILPVLQIKQCRLMMSKDETGQATDEAFGRLDIERLSQEAVDLATLWQQRADALITRKEKRRQSQMASLLRHPLDKATLTRLIDQAFRSSRNARVADQIIYTLKTNDIPDFFTWSEKLLVKLFLKYGRAFPEISVPQFINRIRKFSGQSILPGERAALRSHLKKRAAESVHMNVNRIGEALLGEEEAESRLKIYIADLENPDIEYISVKISTLYSQILPIAFDHTVSVIRDRLTSLFRAARNNLFIRPNGEKTPKFVNLDMEEYRDMGITIAAFTQALDQPEFKHCKAGVALQSYLPDSFNLQRRLVDWARQRVSAGGGPVKLRIVKGANLEMELVESAISNWPLTPYDCKADVDANYKKMILFGMEPDNIAAVNLGVASHNLFELAFAYLAASQRQVLHLTDFEMLEGMADHIRRTIKEETGEVLLYAPAAEKERFINAIAYLIRRLDENTAPDNFLRYAPGLRTGGEEWNLLRDRFLESCRRIEKVDNTPNRTQNRQTESFPEKMGTFHEHRFSNEPDTDWSLAANREWAEQIRKKWMKSPGDPPIEIPLVVAGTEVYEGRETAIGMDSSQLPEKRVEVSQFRLGNIDDVDKAVATAKCDPDGWRLMSHRQRHETLSKAALKLRKGRGDLIGAAAADTGKIFTESDVEVSEAVDFTEFYPQTVAQFLNIETVAAQGKGVGAVVSPWNFPIAIPCGGIAAALASGNTVIFKPASDSVLTAWELCRRFWNAGVPKTALQFLPCHGASVGSRLVEHPDIDFVILTGGTETALRMLSQKPDLFLTAETGGKNATIVTAMADRDQAIKNVIYSAFGNSGQKCSATSLLILEREVYKDPKFKRQLIDAARSFSAGSAWRFSNKMGPLIKPPSGELQKALTTLEPGESWALKPEMADRNPYIWSPGIKWDVAPGSVTHTTEFFGPLLAVMRADDLQHAIEIANQTGYGLTSGLETLDPREIDIWKNGIEAGNLYINRGTTGAVTLRQPFGGMKKSAVGPAIKAGSPNYVSQFMNFKDVNPPIFGPIKKQSRFVGLANEWELKTRWNQFGFLNDEMKKTVRAMKSCLFHYETMFGKELDYFNLRGQDNVLRFLSLGTIIIRLHEDDTLFETLSRLAAALIAGAEPVVSAPWRFDNEVLKFIEGAEGSKLLQERRIVIESDSALSARIAEADRIRYARQDRAPAEIFKAAAKKGIYISCAPVLMEGRVELMHYLQNQSVCHTYHRYGNLGERGLYRRLPPNRDISCEF